MQSDFLKLNWADVGKGIALAVIVTFLGAIEQGLTEFGFNLGMYNWGMILNTSLVAGVGYLLKNLVTTKDGAFLGAMWGRQ